MHKKESDPRVIKEGENISRNSWFKESRGSMSWAADEKQQEGGGRAVVWKLQGKWEEGKTWSREGHRLFRTFEYLLFFWDERGFQQKNFMF